MNKEKLREIIFGYRTKDGKRFDVILLIAIIISVIAVMLDSDKEIHKNYGKLLLIAEWFFTLLFGYWGIFLFSSAPGYLSGDLSMEGNIISYLDRTIMPGKLYLEIHDPEGLFSTIPAISTALLGIYTGNILINTPTSKKTKTTIKLIIIGLLLIIIAQIWNLFFPINKNLWTSSFVLQCGGLSMLLMALFYYLIDILGYNKWAFFFKVIGVNSILIYMSSQFINWNYTTNSFFKWLFNIVGQPYESVIYVICLLTIQWIFLYLLFKRKIFLRV